MLPGSSCCMVEFLPDRRLLVERERAAGLRQHLSLGFNPAGVVDAVDWVGGVEAGWAGQAALVVVVGPFLRGFLIAGWRTAGPERRPLERPGERPEGRRCWSWSRSGRRTPR